MASQQIPMPPHANVQQQQQQQNQPRQSQDVVAIVFGSLILIISTVGICVDIARYVTIGTALYGPGLWFIVVWLLTGIFGVLSGTKGTKPYIITVLVFSILTVILLYVAGAILLADINYIELFNIYSGGSSSGPKYLITLFVLGALLFIFALGSSITACVVLCNCCAVRVVAVERDVPMMVMMTAATSDKPPLENYAAEQATTSHDSYTQASPDNLALSPNGLQAQQAPGAPPARQVPQAPLAWQVPQALQAPQASQASQASQAPLAPPASQASQASAAWQAPQAPTYNNPPNV